MEEGGWIGISESSSGEDGDLVSEGEGHLIFCSPKDGETDNIIFWPFLIFWVEKLRNFDGGGGGVTMVTEEEEDFKDFGENIGH